MKFNQSLLASLVALSCSVFISGCGGGDDDSSSDPNSPSGVEVFVMQNGADNAGTVSRMSGSLNELSSFNVVGNEGIVFDRQGNLFIAGDAGGPPSMLQVVSNAARRSRDENLQTIPDNNFDRQFSVAASANFKGISLAEDAGFVFVANHNGNSIEVFSMSAGSGASAFASFSTPASPWDLTYDDIQDRAYLALTDGRIMVIDSFVGLNFNSANARFITPISGSGGPANMHGIAYVSELDTLVVSDVGSAQVADDGKLYVIPNASTANGNVNPSRVIQGPSTLLGNPVDLEVVGDTVFIAEKSNDKVLGYNNIFEGDSGDIEADFSVDVVKPESVAIVPRSLPSVTDISDVEDNTAVAAVAVSLNPANPTDNPDLIQLSTDLSGRVGQPPAVFVTRKTVESIKYNSAGNAFVTFDENGTGGVYVINRAATSRSLSEPSRNLDRTIQGPNTGLISPKGLDFAEEMGWIIVTENAESDPSVKVFAAEAEGNASPIINTPLPVRPWDADYDPDSDTLYVSGVDGSVLVFDDYSEDGGSNGPDRIIRPTIDGESIQAPTNLHGIVYVESENMLLLSDVGSGQIPTDGKLYGIANASRADGDTDVEFSIDNGDNNSAGNTLLGNPVDIAFDGQNLYVAEKSQNFVLRFDNILDTDGGDVSPTFTSSQIAPESVALLPSVILNSN